MGATQLMLQRRFIKKFSLFQLVHDPTMLNMPILVQHKGQGDSGVLKNGRPYSTLQAVALQHGNPHGNQSCSKLKGTIHFLMTQKGSRNSQSAHESLSRKKAASHKQSKSQNSFPSRS